MTEIKCDYRSLNGEQPVCRIVADITDRPLVECRVNDSACAHCLGCGVAPQAPNVVTASMAIGVAQRTGDPLFFREMIGRMNPHLRQPQQLTPENTPCIKRGKVIRQQECKPCQQNGGGKFVPVFACPEFGECTIGNTGVTPKIQGCATCPPDKRCETSYQLTHVNPPEVVKAVAEQTASRRGGR